MSSLCTCWARKWTYLTSMTFKTKTYFIPLWRIHPSGHSNLWSSAQVLPSCLVLLCAPLPGDRVPALFAHHLYILLSAVACYKKSIRKRVKCCLFCLFSCYVHFRQDGFESATYFLSAILLCLYLEGTQEKRTWYFQALEVKYYT